MIISILIFYSSKSYKIGNIKTTEKKVSKEFVDNYFKTKRNFLLILSSIFIAFFQAGLLNWIVRFMILKFDSATFGSITISLFWICTTISRFLIPQLKISQLKALGYGVLISGILVFIALNSGSPLLTIALVGGAGFTCGHCIPTLINLGTEHYEDSTSFPTSILLLSMSAGRLIIPLIMGVVGEFASIYYAMLLPVGAAILAFITYYYLNKEDNIEQR